MPCIRGIPRIRKRSAQGMEMHTTPIFHLLLGNRPFQGCLHEGHRSTLNNDIIDCDGGHIRSRSRPRSAYRTVCHWTGQALEDTGLPTAPAARCLQWPFTKVEETFHSMRHSRAAFSHGHIVVTTQDMITVRACLRDAGMTHDDVHFMRKLWCTSFCLRRTWRKGKRQGWGGSL